MNKNTHDISLSVQASTISWSLSVFEEDRFRHRMVAISFGDVLRYKCSRNVVRFREVVVCGTG